MQQKKPCRSANKMLAPNLRSLAEEKDSSIKKYTLYTTNRDKNAKEDLDIHMLNLRNRQLAYG